MKSAVLCIAVLFACSPWSNAVEEVYWVLTSTDGKEMKAWIRKVENDQVTFRRDDGKVFTIPITRLSEEDQAELKKLQEAKPAPAAPEAKVNKRLYPRGLSEMKAACVRIREAAGALKGFTDEEREAIAELNIYRYLSGVPSQVALERSCCEIAVRASEGCAKIGQLSHDAVPEGKSCNLHQGQASFAQSVHGYMEDPGDRNRSHRGHRMWCLHPNLTKSGFGCDAEREFFAMWVSNGGLAADPKARRREKELEFYAYPGDGYYPVGRLRGQGWSVYSGAPLSAEEPEIHVYELTSRPAAPFTSATIPKDAKEVKIDYQKRNGDEGGWTRGWIVFEPQVTPEPGKIFWVSVESGRVRIGYAVEFIDGEF
jgi:hypothetical protein